MAKDDFNGFYETMMEREPQMAFMGRVRREPLAQGGGMFSTAPMAQRARDYWANQFSNVYNSYRGLRGNELRTGKDPSQWTTFGQFLERQNETPFTQRYAALTPYQRGTSTSRFAPSTRHIYF